jgi:hypothetical protein
VSLRHRDLPNLLRLVRGVAIVVRIADPVACGFARSTLTGTGASRSVSPVASRMTVQHIRFPSAIGSKSDASPRPNLARCGRQVSRNEPRLAYLNRPNAEFTLSSAGDGISASAAANAAASGSFSSGFIGHLQSGRS